MTHTHAYDISNYKAALRRHTLKATPQRVAVHESMLRLVHASADMIADDIHKIGRISITAATVYNILSQMSDLGIYRRRLSSNNKMYFDVDPEPHYHLYDCENHCFRNIEDMEMKSTIDRCLRKRKFRGYSIENIDMQIIVRPTKRKKIK